MPEHILSRDEPSKKKPRTSIERIVGNSTAEQKQNIMDKMVERFDDQLFEELVGKEREKTPDEQKVIQLANDATNALRVRFGLPEFDVPPQNIHIIRSNEWGRAGVGGAYNSQLQGVVMPEVESKMAFAERVVHEMLHFKSYNALQVTMKLRLRPYRAGLAVYDRYEAEPRLENLDEAITEELTKRIVMQNISQDPLFADEKKQTAEFIATRPKGMFHEDTYLIEPKKGESGKLVTYDFSYKRERAMLRTLVEKLRERHPGKWKDDDEVLDIFARGMFIGDLLEIGRLIDRTFGKGALRKIAELDDDIEKQLKYVESL